MAIVTSCTAPGCETLTIGPLCVVHDLPVERVFVRGRPFLGLAPVRELRPALTLSTASASRLRTASARAAAVPLRR